MLKKSGHKFAKMSRHQKPGHFGRSTSATPG